MSERFFIYSFTGFAAMANKFNLNLQQGYAQQLSFNGATKNYDSVKGLLMRCSLAVYCI